MNDNIGIINSNIATAKDVNFLSVNIAHDLDTLVSDGLLGLSPKVRKWGNWISEDNQVHLLVNQLKKDGVISKAMFSMYLTEYTSQSKV